MKPKYNKLLTLAQINKILVTHPQMIEDIKEIGRIHKTPKERKYGK